MKKSIYLLTILLGLGLASCKTCVDCSNCQWSGDETEICKARYETKVSFNARVANYESSTGCQCD